MIRFVFLLSIALSVTVSAFGGSPIAAVTSPEPFELSGVTVPVRGVPSWPLVDGDEIATKDSEAVILFEDRSRVVLDKNTRAKLERKGNRTTVRLLTGGLKYSLATGSLLRLFALGRQVRPEAVGIGTVSIEGESFVAAGGAGVLALPARPDGLPPRSPSDCGGNTGRSPCSPNN